MKRQRSSSTALFWAVLWLCHHNQKAWAFQIHVVRSNLRQQTTLMPTTIHPRNGFSNIANNNYPEIQQRTAPRFSSRTQLSAMNNNNKNSADDATTSIDSAAAQPQEPAYREALVRTGAWVTAALAFGSALWVFGSPTMGEEFFAGYLVEQSLSVDNLFVFLLLFDYFRVPEMAQPKILNWGIYGAMVMRAGMIGVGAAALEQYHEILLVFAAILVYSSGKIVLELFSDDDEAEEDPGQNAIVKFSRSVLPSTPDFDGDKFFTLVDGVKTATPLFICMIALEISDVVFAVDSIPAVFGVTEDPMIVFTSNIFAIMGLRSLFTILSKAAGDLQYLEPAVGVVLGFIGSKMIAEYFGYHVPTNVALAVVVALLGTGVGASLVLDDDEDAEEAPGTTAPSKES